LQQVFGAVAGELVLFNIGVYFGIRD